MSLIAEQRSLRWSELRQELRMYRELLSLAQMRLRFLPLMIALALVESLFEGVSLALIIPLIQVLGDGIGAGSRGRLLQFLSDLMAGIPKDYLLISVLLAILGAVILKSVVGYANMVVLGVVYGRLSHKLRTGIFRTVLSMPLAALERERSGRLLNTLNNETWRATDALNALFSIITSLATLFVLLTLLCLLSWRLTLVALLCVAFIPPLIQTLNRRIKKLSELGLKANEALAKRTWTALSGLRTIHAFGREDYEAERFTENSQRVRSIFFRMALISMTTGPVTDILVTAIVGMLALLIDASRVALPMLVGFLAILYRLQPRVTSLGTLRTRLVSLHASVAEVAKIMTASRTAPTKSGKLQFARLRDGIRFDNVTFTYSGASRAALSDVSFFIPHASIFAIVGSSGAGKSTVLDLLLRFQDPQIGSIEVDGVSLSALDLKSWRSRIAIVGQDPYIFDDTVRANILYGKLNAAESELVEATKLACAHDFISELPGGYDTVIGERGTQISGGQRQRLSLARALIRSPEILILDEATNALDAATERAFQEALKLNAHELTVIIVAHRLSMVEMADKAIVLVNGRAVEEGHPSVLLDENGQFAQMFAAEKKSRRDHATSHTS